MASALTTTKIFGTTIRVWLAASAGVAAIAVDLALCLRGTTDLQIRALPALVAFVALFGLSGGRRERLGVLLCPKQGWRYWILPAAIAGAAILFLSAVYCLVFPSAWSVLVLNGQLLSDDGVGSRILFACLETPLLEETLYRLVLCASLVSIIGRVPTILVSGFVFALLHVVYRNASPDNAVAGFVLAWAFLRSESLVLPIVMHGLGNLSVIAIELLAAALAR